MEVNNQKREKENNMSTVSNWNCLSKYGIQNLTGEADRYSLRMLCDVNEEGKRLLETFFGGNVEIKNGSNWNSAVNGKPAVGSIMLPYGIFQDLAVFCLFHIDQMYAVVLDPGWYYGIESKTKYEEHADWLKEKKVRINFAWTENPNVSLHRDRNKHQMSGRTT